MSDSLTELKQHPKILELYRTRLSLKQDGRRWRGPCPYHLDTHATNFDIFQHEGTWVFKCLSCGQAGSILDLIQKTDGADFKGAVKIVREYCSEFAGDRARVESVFRPVSQEAQSVKTYPEESYKAYEQALQQSQAGQDFLASRGIALETAKRLRIGFRADVGRLAGEAGVEIASAGWLSFATFSEDVVTSVKFRSVARKAFTKLAGMGTYLWNTSSIDGLAPVFLVEGEMDVLTLEQAGFPSVGLPNAQYHLTPADKDLLLNGASEVILAGDNDDAGRKAMDKLFREMKERTYWLRWPDGVKDANEYFLKVCSGNVDVFRTRVNELAEVARSKPMSGVYDVRQSLLTANHSSSIDHPDRWRFPWKSVDDMAVILPGDVVSLYSTDSGMGKTSLILQASLFAAMKHNKVILNYQAEMMPQQIDTIITSHLLKKDRLTLGQDDYRMAGQSLPANMKYYIGRDTSLTNISQVLDLIEAGIRRFGPDGIILDNLHFLCRNENDPIKAQSNASQRIKNLAGEYGVVWFNVHQARKADQNHKRKVTHISDMDGSKAIQNDSSVVFSVHREEVKHARDEESGSHEYDPITEIRLQKVREKGPGKSFTQLLFVGGISTFSEVAKVEKPNLFSDGRP